MASTQFKNKLKKIGKQNENRLACAFKSKYSIKTLIKKFNSGLLHRVTYYKPLVGLTRLTFFFDIGTQIKKLIFLKIFSYSHLLISNSFLKKKT